MAGGADREHRNAAAACARGHCLRRAASGRGAARARAGAGTRWSVLGTGAAGVAAERRGRMGRHRPRAVAADALADRGAARAARSGYVLRDGAIVRRFRVVSARPRHRRRAGCSRSPAHARAPARLLRRVGRHPHRAQRGAAALRRRRRARRAARSRRSEPARPARQRPQPRLRAPRQRGDRLARAHDRQRAPCWDAGGRALNSSGPGEAGSPTRAVG